MAFELRAEEPVGKGVKRVLRRQLDAAVSGLSGPDADADATLHDARKRLKKARGLLRLVRDSLGEKVYRRENRRFRDAGRPLSQVRDAKVLIDTLDGLLAGHGGEVKAKPFARLREALEAKRREAREGAPGSKDGLARVREAAEEGRAEAKHWSIRPGGWQALRPGLKKVYKAGRRALAAAAGDASVENLHQWRKQAKYLRYVIRLLKPVSPRPMGRLADRAHDLEQTLGRDHDLAVLRQVVEAADDEIAREGDREKLLALIDRRRSELQREAFRLGRRVYRDKPGDFLRLVKQYWKAWRRAAKSGAAAP